MRKYGSKHPLIKKREIFDISERRKAVKKLWIGLAAIVLAATTASGMTTVKGEAAATIADNYGAYVVASGELSGGDGLTTYYTKIGDGNGIMTFDLLSDNTFGWFGLICGDVTNINDLDALKDYALFGKDVKTTLDLGELDFSFEAGYTYKATFNASGSKLSLEQKEIGETDDAYTLVFETATTFEKSNVIGMAALSEGRDSSTVIIDNLTITDLKGKTNYVNNTFDGSSTVKDDSMKIGVYNTSTDATGSVGNVYLHKDALYTVRFVDESGKLIATQRVCLYGSAKAPSAPTKEGYDFVAWSSDLDNIRKDTLMYPLYEVHKDEPVNSQPSSSQDEPKDSVSSEQPTESVPQGGDSSKSGGCSGTIAVTAGIFAALTAAGVALACKRREDR